jgi:hypothetical protein
VVLLFTGWALALAALVAGTAWLAHGHGGALARGATLTPVEPRDRRAVAARLEPQEVLEALPRGVVLGERRCLGSFDG